jgi:hypothetical protein
MNQLEVVYLSESVSAGESESCPRADGDRDPGPPGPATPPTRSPARGPRVTVTSLGRLMSRRQCFG